MPITEFNITKLDHGIFLISAERTCNIGVCIKDNHALVIDSGGSPVTGQAVINVIKQELNADIEILLNTHYHSDHTFGNQAFQCPILASTECHEMMKYCLNTDWHPREIKQAMEDDQFLNEVWQDLSIKLPTDTFKDRRQLDFYGFKMVLEKYPGHTADSILTIFPNNRLVFAGDIVFGRRYPTMLEHDADPDQLIASLKKIKAIDFKTIIPGHGDPDDKLLIDFSIAYWQCLVDKIERLKRGGQPADEAIEVMMTSCHLKNVPFDEFRHRRNVKSVVKYIFERPDTNSA